ncbi:hypothetical protein J5X91_09880 [Pseudoalteromonas sp. K222D]|uniref:hypothetical protein n=1 Tax=Pseudoalteromonas sp. K222D TaxID=2820756 RepID=UPI001AD6FBFC|nr:hypothetical protein [Pseudoalteromonas sp. K222D]MBO7926574.1 hypothetical protein [Pseudoalteromonas sp. K222D]
MKPYNIDIPVLILFFVRPEQLNKVFEAIKEARPSKLYLFQDGPRAGNLEDISKIEECRKIVANIDWDCEVHRSYQSKNFGCDPSNYMAQKWMFSHEEYGMVFEDDSVPAQSFFPFCKELLEKYKYDTRMGMICGMNNLGTVESPYSYVFSQSGSIWGWATWRRTVELWDENYSWLDDLDCLSKLQSSMDKELYNLFIKSAKNHRQSGKAHYESILGAAIFLNNLLNIIPHKNMISNVGIASESTHAVDNIKKLPRGIRRLFFMKTYELDFPLKHPKYIQNDMTFKKNIDNLMGNGQPVKRLFRRLESFIYRLVRN